jgi:hypothetical protein
MIRALYQCLLAVHPRAFRRQFAGEMLWIFDEASESEGVWTLFADGLCSLFRQWILRSGSWKIVAALTGAWFQVTIGGLGMTLIGRSQIASHVSRGARSAKLQQLPLADFIWLTVCSVGLVSMIVVLVTLWVKRLNASRLRRPRTALLR